MRAGSAAMVLALGFAVGAAAQGPSFDGISSGALGSAGDQARDVFGMRGAGGTTGLALPIPGGNPGTGFAPSAPHLASPDPGGGPGVVKPVDQGVSQGWDGSLGAVRVTGVAGSLDGHRVQSAGSGTLYRIDPAKGEVVVEHKITLAGGTPFSYYMTYSPLTIDPAILGRQMAPVGAGSTLGRVKGPELRVGCWRYGTAGGVVPIPINLPGVRYPDGTPPGQGRGPF